MKKARIFDNIGLKLLAVFISILLWLVVLNVSDPVRTNTYNDVPIRVENGDTITNQGKVYDLRDAKTVSVVVSAKRSILDSLDKDNFSAVIDLSRMDLESGVATVRVESNKYSESIESMKSKTEYVDVAIEDMMRKQFFITPIVTGEPEEGYVIGDVNTAENIVRISGAESVVSSIKKVTAEVSVSGLSRSINTSVDLKLYDEDGNQIKDFNLTKNISTVAVSAQILETKEVSLAANNYIGEPADGYAVVGDMTLSQQSVLIAGKSANLAALNALEIPPTAMNVDGLTETTEFEVDLNRYLPDGIILADAESAGTIVVTVPIEQMMTRKMELPTNLIEIKNVPEGYKATVGNEIALLSVELYGIYEQVEAITVSDLQATTDFAQYMENQDMTELHEGTYRLPLTILCKGESSVTVAKEYNVNVIITKIEEE